MGVEMRLDIDADDAASPKIDKLNAKIGSLGAGGPGKIEALNASLATLGTKSDDVSGKIKSATSSMASNFANLHFAVTDAMVVMQKAFEAVERFANYAEVKEQLNLMAGQFGIAGDAIVASMKRITGGQFSIEQATSSAAAALKNSLTPAQIEGLSQAAVTFNDIADVSVPEAFNRLAEAVQKGSAKAAQAIVGKDGLGDAMKDLAKGADDAGKSGVLYDAIMAKVAEQSRVTGTATKSLGDNIDKLKATLQNITLYAAGATVAVLYSVTGVFTAAAAAATRTASAVMGLYSSYQLLQGKFKDAQDSIQISKDLWGSASELSAKADQYAVLATSVFDTDEAVKSLQKTAAKKFSLGDDSTADESVDASAWMKTLRKKADAIAAANKKIAADREKQDALYLSTQQALAKMDLETWAQAAADRLEIEQNKNANLNQGNEADISWIRRTEAAQKKSIGALAAEITKWGDTYKSLDAKHEAVMDRIKAREKDYAATVDAIGKSISSVNDLISNLGSANFSDAEKKIAARVKIEKDLAEAEKIVNPESRIAALGKIAEVVAKADATLTQAEINEAKRSKNETISAAAYEADVVKARDAAQVQLDALVAIKGKMEAAKGEANAAELAASVVEEKKAAGIAAAMKAAVGEIDTLKTKSDALILTIKDKYPFNVEVDEALENLKKVRDEIEAMRQLLKKDAEFNVNAFLTASPTLPFSVGVEGMAKRLQSLPTVGKFNVIAGGASGRSGGTSSTTTNTTNSATLNASIAAGGGASAKKIDRDMAALWKSNRSALKRAMGGGR